MHQTTLGRVIAGACVSLILAFAVYQSIPDEMVPKRIRQFVSTNQSSREIYEELQKSRVENWQVALSRVESRGQWIFGVGPRLDVVVDNGYLEILYSQGIVGFLIAVSVCAWPLFTLREVSVLSSPAIVATVFTILVAFAVFSLSGPVITSPKLGP